MKFSGLILIGSASFALAHPGHGILENELIYKRNYNAHARRGLQACNADLQKRGVFDRAQARRAATVEKHRRALQARKRDTDTVANTSHLSNASYTTDTAETTIFGESNDCVISPEGEVGPFWVPGEYLRSDLREDQAGIPVVLEAQFLDVETCEPLTEAWWDLWNCNATGVYSGVVGNGNGNGDDTANVNNTFLRGIQKTDGDGVVTFETIFPGHYAGRATHHHAIVYLDATVNSNGTLSGGSYAHVGQLFWDQDLITKVEATSPYNTNTIEITENIDDRVFGTETADTTSDPVFEYVYIGDDLSDGIFGWITIVVNTSATYDPSYSFILTEDGGEAESGGSGSAISGSGGSTGNSTGLGGPPGTSLNGTAGTNATTATSSNTTTYTGAANPLVGSLRDSYLSALIFSGLVGWNTFW